MVIVGLISDTHGLLRPEALDLLRGSDLIIHAGDVGDPQILGELARLAPVTAVRGNVDTGAWARSVPERAVLAVGASVRLYVLHAIEDLDLDPAAAGYQAVIYGHVPQTRRTPERRSSICQSRQRRSPPLLPAHLRGPSSRGGRARFRRSD